MSRLWALAVVVLLGGCSDDDGPDPRGAGEGGALAGEGEGEGEVVTEPGCLQLCERLDTEGLLCGGSDVGRSVDICVRVCAGGGVPDGLDIAGADCRTITDSLPDGMILPCRCPPAADGFQAIADGPVAACAGCHPDFTGNDGYDEVSRRVGDLLHPDEGSLFCNAMGCRAHPGGNVWGSPGSCDWRTILAWVADAAPPGDDCEDFETPVDCVGLCGDEPPPDGECDAGDQPDPEDFCRFVGEVEPGLVADCGGCHGGGMGGFAIAGGDSDANYEAALTKSDRESAAESLLLTKPVGGGGHPAPWTDVGCKFLATRAWIARAPAPDCIGGD